MNDTVIKDRYFRKKETLLVGILLALPVMVWGIFRISQKIFSMPDFGDFGIGFITLLFLVILATHASRYLYLGLNSAKQILKTENGTMEIKYYLARSVSFNHDKIVRILKKTSYNGLLKSFFDKTGTYYRVELDDGRFFLLDSDEDGSKYFEKLNENRNYK